MRKPGTYDCGIHGQLTAAEISRRAGITVGSVYARVGQGVQREALLDPPVPVSQRKKGRQHFTLENSATTGTVTVYLAVRVTTRYPGRVPTVSALQSDFGMSRATAYRWRDAIRDALGVTG